MLWGLPKPHPFLRNSVHLGVGRCPTFVSAENLNTAVVLQSKSPLQLLLLSLGAQCLRNTIRSCLAVLTVSAWHKLCQQDLLHFLDSWKMAEEGKWAKYLSNIQLCCNEEWNSLFSENAQIRLILVPYQHFCCVLLQNMFPDTCTPKCKLRGRNSILQKEAKFQRKQFWTMKVQVETLLNTTIRTVVTGT